jgi:hypothetical protein
MSDLDRMSLGQAIYVQRAAKRRGNPFAVALAGALECDTDALRIVTMVEGCRRPRPAQGEEHQNWPDD